LTEEAIDLGAADPTEYKTALSKMTNKIKSDAQFKEKVLAALNCVEIA